MSEFGKSDRYGERLDYTNNKCRDWIWGILYYLHVIGVAIGIAYIYAVDIPNINKEIGKTDDKPIKTIDMTGIYVTILISIICGLIIGIIWWQIFKAFSNNMIKIVYSANIIMWVIMAVVGLGAQQIGMIICGAIFATFFGLYFWCTYPLIPFSSVLLTVSLDVISKYTGIWWVLLLGAFIDVCWLFLWSGMCGGYLYTFYSDPNNQPQGWVLFLMVLSLYWGLCVNNNVVRVTACGVAGTWYFSASDSYKPTTPAFARTIFTSFGSICFGSIFVSIVEVIRVVITALARDSESNSACSCLCMCMVSCIESVLNYFNTYSFAHIAIYGTSFIDSSKATWKLFKHSGIIMILNDDLTGTVTFSGSLVSGLITAAIAYGIGYVFYRDDPNSDIQTYFPQLLAVYGGIAGLVLANCTLSVIRSFVATVFVCYTEDPFAMQENRPIYYNKIVNANPKMRNVMQNVVGTMTDDE